MTRRWLLFGAAIAVLAGAPLAAQTPSCSDLARNYWFRFSSGPILHVAHLRMIGCTGRMWVRFFDAGSQKQVTVTQVMQIRQSDDGMWLEGSNPVDSATGIAHATYQPDKFLFQMMANGRLGIVNCDQRPCREVTQAMSIVLSNTCDEPISVALVYSDAGDADAWIRAGWWKVQPHQTTQTYVQTFADSFYVRGQGTSRKWSGPDSFVVSPAQFRARLNQLVLSRQGQRAGFTKVDVPDRAQTYTQQFICRPRTN